MNQEDKNILFSDISSRLRYGVKCQVVGYEEVCTLVGIDYVEMGVGVRHSDEHYTGHDIDEVKPLLRPLSSMTLKEEKVLNELGWVLYREGKESFIGAEDIEEPLDGGGYQTTYITNSKLYKIMNFLNSHHFDYNGLIEKSLAIEAHNDIYKEEKPPLNKEDIKELLLKDLSARLPYGVKCGIVNSPNSIFTLRPNDINDFDDVLKYEPYLRPMSNMTEEEKKEYEETCIITTQSDSNECIFVPTDKTYDFLNKHGFDYRGLIEKGLAIEACDSMYN